MEVGVFLYDMVIIVNNKKGFVNLDADTQTCV